MLKTSLLLTPTAASTGVDIQVEGATVTSGASSAALGLNVGSTTLEIQVSSGNLSRTYEIQVSRGAEDVVKSAFVKASNTGGLDRFATAIALDEDTLVVGAYTEDSSIVGTGGGQDNDGRSGSGAVYVFTKNGNSWEQTAYLKSSNPSLGDLFGISVAISGDTLAVGATGEDSSADGVNGSQTNEDRTDSGAVYVFRRSGNDWVQEAYLKASNPDEMDGFGETLAIHGDTLAVGTIREASSTTGVDGTQNNDDMAGSGAVYLFRRTGSPAWMQEAYLKASNTDSDDNFGASLALRGGRLAVGAPLEDSVAVGIGGAQNLDTAMDSGAVYVFDRTDTTWSQSQYLKASASADGVHFGASVAIFGSRLAVGAPGESGGTSGVGGDPTPGASSESGAAYLFLDEQNTWAQEAYVKASNASNVDKFGSSVALSEDLLAVGAENEATRGAAYLFSFSANTWSEHVLLRGFDLDDFDRYGGKVALSNGILAVATDGDDSISKGIDGDETDDQSEESGAVFMYR